MVFSRKPWTELRIYPTPPTLSRAQGLRGPNLLVTVLSAHQASMYLFCQFVDILGYMVQKRGYSYKGLPVQHDVCWLSNILIVLNYSLRCQFVGTRVAYHCRAFSTVLGSAKTSRFCITTFVNFNELNRCTSTQRIFMRLLSFFTLHCSLCKPVRVHTLSIGLSSQTPLEKCFVSR